MWTFIGTVLVMKQAEDRPLHAASLRRRGGLNGLCVNY